MTAQFRARSWAMLLLLAAADAGQAVAEQRQTAQAAAASSEFRGATRGRQGYVDHIWKLETGGRITGLSTERRGGGLGGYSIDLSDTGRWQVRPNQLCIEWNGAFRPLSGCYSILRQQGTHVRMEGPASFEGTLDPPL